MTVTEKIQALLRKTVAAGATPGEQAAAVAKAKELVEKNGLKASSFKWPPEPKPAPAKKAKAASKKRVPKAKAGKTRSQRMAELLSRASGVSLDELMKEFGIQQHTARAYISVESRKLSGKKAVLRDGRYHLA